jgi:hypothetical protein
MPSTEQSQSAAMQRGTASGRASKDRYRVKRELMRYLAALGIRTEQVPLSDAPAKRLSPQFGDDFEIWLFGPDASSINEKARPDGSEFGLLDRWLGDHDRLILRLNELRPMIVLSRQTWERLLAGERAP